MTWADFYLVCFVVGFFLSLLMFLGGGLHLHIPHFHFHTPATHIHLAGHAPSPHGASAGPRGSQVSPFNLITLTAFLAWFGGTGFLLTRHSMIWFWAALGISLLSGTGGAAIIYLFLSRVLSSPDEALDPADYEMVGFSGGFPCPFVKAEPESWSIRKPGRAECAEREQKMGRRFQRPPKSWSRVTSEALLTFAHGRSWPEKKANLASQ